MTYNYEIIIEELSKSECVVRTDELGNVVYIPTDPVNSDYQRYLRWLENPDAEEGGTL